MICEYLTDSASISAFVVAAGKLVGNSDTLLRHLFSRGESIALAQPTHPEGLGC